MVPNTYGLFDLLKACYGPAKACEACYFGRPALTSRRALGYVPLAGDASTALVTGAAVVACPSG